MNMVRLRLATQIIICAPSQGCLFAPLQVTSMEDVLGLPRTKWNIQQPAMVETDREDALQTGDRCTSSKSKELI